MCKRSGRWVEMITNICEAARKKCVLPSIVAYADEPSGDGAGGESGGNGDGDNPPTQTINYEDLISKARQDEKQKQYNKIKDLQGKLDTMTSKNNELILQVGQLEKDIEEAKNKLVEAGKGDSEEVKTLKNEISTLKEELEKTKKELESTPKVDRDEVEKEIRAVLEKEYEVKTYRAEQLAQYANDPTVLPELVTGDTKEDIDATLKAALERSKSIKESLGLKMDGTPDMRRNVNTQVQPPLAPATNPATQGGMGESREDMMQQLVTMDVASPEYAELRKKLGLI